MKRLACFVMIAVGCSESTVTPTKTTATATVTATATATAAPTATASQTETAAPEPSSEPLGPDATAIQKTVRANFNRLRRCYEEGLKRNPDLEGRVKITFTIRADGTVEKIDTATRPLLSTRPSKALQALPDAEVARCIHDVFGTLKFATRPKETVVTYPIVFSPG